MELKPPDVPKLQSWSPSLDVHLAFLFSGAGLLQWYSLLLSDFLQMKQKDPTSIMASWKQQRHMNQLRQKMSQNFDA